MINPFHYISSFFNSILKKKEYEQTKFVSLPPSGFQNIREYDHTGEYEPQVTIIELVPILNGNKIEFLQRKTYPIVPIDKTINRSLASFDFDSVELENIKRELDKIIFFELSEMGRITALTLSKRKDNMPMLALSHQTTKDSIIYKIKFADNLLKDMNGIGIKNITVSNSIFTKIKESIKDGVLEINKKEVQVHILPEYLDKEDELCLLLSSIQKDSENPSLIFNKTLVTVVSKITKDNAKSTRISFNYGLHKCGTNNDFSYLRFFKT